jgi:hypothetical protein
MGYVGIAKRGSRTSWSQENDMAGRGPQSFKKRMKEQQRKEKQQEKAQRRAERKSQPLDAQQDDLKVLDRPYVLPEFLDDVEPDEGVSDQEAYSKA